VLQIFRSVVDDPVGDCCPAPPAPPDLTIAADRSRRRRFHFCDFRGSSRSVCCQNSPARASRARVGDHNGQRGSVLRIRSAADVEGDPVARAARFSGGSVGIRSAARARERWKKLGRYCCRARKSKELLFFATLRTFRASRMRPSPASKKTTHSHLGPKSASHRGSEACSKSRRAIWLSPLRSPDQTRCV